MTADSSESPLLKISLDGEVVAEAYLTVRDPAKAWTAFLEAFPTFAPLIVGELLNTMRIACHEDLQMAMGPQGIIIDLSSPSRPRLYIPDASRN